MTTRRGSNRIDLRPPEFFSADVAAARRFFLNLKPPAGRELAVVCGGLEHCTPGYVISRETFPFHTIEYVVRGHGELKLKGRTSTLRPGRLFSYGPGIPHQIKGDAADPLVKYFVNFTGARAPGLLRECRLWAGRASEVFPARAPQPLFDELIRAGLEAGRERGPFCTKLLECLASRIACARAPLAGAETPAFATYQHCRRHIEEHSLRLRTLEQIARECHVTGAYLCRLFRRYENQSPYQYLLRLKMNEAAALLQKPGALVKQVAEASGFQDPFHFSRLFASVFGVSPAAFRGLR